MKITICGSIAFYDQMLETKAALEKLGHSVDLPPHEINNEKGEKIDVREYYRLRHSETDETSWIWKRKKEAMLDHFHKIDRCDAILVLNIDKNGIPGYIGANTFLEMGLALYQNKPIYLLNPASTKLSYYEEILGCHPVVLSHDLSKIPLGENTENLVK